MKKNASADTKTEQNLGTIVHLSHRNSVCVSICLSVRHTGESVKNGES